MSIDEISLMLGKLVKGQEDNTEWLKDLKKDIAELKAGGCAMGADHEKRIKTLEENPNKLAAGLSGAISVFVNLIMETGKRMIGP